MRAVDCLARWRALLSRCLLSRYTRDVIRRSYHCMPPSCQPLVARRAAHVRQAHAAPPREYVERSWRVTRSGAYIHVLPY